MFFFFFFFFYGLKNMVYVRLTGRDDEAWCTLVGAALTRYIRRYSEPCAEYKKNKKKIMDTAEF